jgi:hypothetical protein
MFSPIMVATIKKILRPYKMKSLAKKMGLNFQSTVRTERRIAGYYLYQNNIISGERKDNLIKIYDEQSPLILSRTVVRINDEEISPKIRSGFLIPVEKIEQIINGTISQEKLRQEVYIQISSLSLLKLFFFMFSVVVIYFIILIWLIIF